MSQMKRVVETALAMRMTAVVDYDFPEVLHHLDNALKAFEKLPKLPKIICLCGSTRFYQQFQEANFRLTMKGNIVLSVGFYPHSPEVHGEGVGVTDAQKVELDELHMRKIDLCDEVFILNVGGYIGHSTRNEIEYARKTAKIVHYLEAPKLRDMP